MNTKTIFFVGLFGAVLGCAANQAAQVYTASAQGGSQARPGQFRECSLLLLDYANDHGRLARVAKPLGGWTPVGGFGGVDRTNGVVVCR